jgi:hypothetical protein
MKAIVVHQSGPPEVLRYEEIPTPGTRPGWSVVKVQAVGVNRSEIFTRQGLSPTVTFPRVLGIECVGVVADSTTPTLMPGQKVAALMGGMGREFDGGYAEYVLLPNDRIWPVHTSLTWEEFGAVPETFVTALGSIKQLRLRADSRLLVRAATSGVGVATIQLVRALYPNAVIVGTTRKESKFDTLKALGCDEVILEDPQNAIQADEKFDSILDLIGPSAIRHSFAVMKRGGIVCNTGLLGGQWTLENFDPIIDTCGGYLTGYHSGDATAALLQDAITIIEAHAIDVTPHKVLPLQEASQAHALMESGAGYGKYVLLPAH